MVEKSLATDLRDYLRECFKGYVLPTKGPAPGVPGEPREPKIFNGRLPLKRTKGEDDFPFIMVRLDSGATDLDASTVSVAIVVGCYDEGIEGHDLCLNVMAKIRNALFALPCGTLSQKYQLRPGFSWELYPEQAWPYCQLDIKTEWLLAPPRFDAGEFVAIGEL